jgi:hypothetical protein
MNSSIATSPKLLLYAKPGHYPSSPSFDTNNRETLCKEISFMKASPVTITQYKSEHWRSDGDLLISTCKEISELSLANQWSRSRLRFKHIQANVHSKGERLHNLTGQLQIFLGIHFR